MLRFIAVAVAVLLSAAWAQADIMSYCRDKWSDNYSMQEYCVKKERQAKANVDQWYRDNMDFDLLNRCTEKWTKDFEPIHSMIIYCLDKEQKAKEWLQQNGG
ncbi:MAG: hypothetical protein C4563_06525 [Desulfobulbus sp.]|jgi:hypothetical protein|nr:MAG: hypothetical protein C4563_06525 [Desulfobulbus sp.]